MKAVLMILAALPLLATSGSNGDFRGRVLDASGTRHIANAIVTVTTPGGYVSSVTTNKAGEFAFTFLPAGQYDFRITAHGYAIYERQVTVANDIGVRELAIRLVVPADKQTVSVTELQNRDISRSGVYYQARR